MLGFVLKSAAAATAFFGPFGQLAKKYTRFCLHSWSTTSNKGAQVAAYICIHRLAVILPFPQVDTCLKGLYLAYVKAATSYTELRAPQLRFMEDCIVELFGIDVNASYQVC